MVAVGVEGESGPDERPEFAEASGEDPFVEEGASPREVLGILAGTACDSWGEWPARRSSRTRRREATRRINEGSFAVVANGVADGLRRRYAISY